MTAAATHAAIEAVWRIESPRLYAGLVRMVRDLGRAEELAQEALLAALERWPSAGVPDNPGAWLMAAAKNRAIDELRRDRLLERKHQELGQELEALGEAAVAPDLDAALDDDVGDDLLRLVFVACHPVLSTDARAAHTNYAIPGTIDQRTGIETMTEQRLLGLALRAMVGPVSIGAGDLLLVLRDRAREGV